jgi:dTDP-4-amino-4,6-dideoxygalactose transaminase
MNSHQIFPGIHYPLPVHLNPAYIQDDYSSPAKLAITERISKKILSLPIYPELSECDIERVCDILI